MSNSKVMIICMVLSLVVSAGGVFPVSEISLLDRIAHPPANLVNTFLSKPVGKSEINDYCRSLMYYSEICSLANTVWFFGGKGIKAVEDGIPFGAPYAALCPALKKQDSGFNKILKSPIAPSTSPLVIPIEERFKSSKVDILSGRYVHIVLPRLASETKDFKLLLPSKQWKSMTKGRELWLRFSGRGRSTFQILMAGHLYDFDFNFNYENKGSIANMRFAKLG